VQLDNTTNTMSLIRSLVDDPQFSHNITKPTTPVQTRCSPDISYIFTIFMVVKLTC